MNIKIKKTREDAIIPTNGSLDAAGYDLYAAHDAILFSHTTNQIDTGIAMQIPKGYVGLIWDRSGLGSKGLKVHGGVIDSDFIGNISVVLSNTTDIEYYRINKGDRIAQILIQPIMKIEFEEVKELEKTERGEKGFGASGK